MWLMKNSKRKFSFGRQIIRDESDKRDENFQIVFKMKNIINFIQGDEILSITTVGVLAQF